MVEAEQIMVDEKDESNSQVLAEETMKAKRKSMKYVFVRIFLETYIRSGTLRYWQPLSRREVRNDIN